MPRTLAVGVVAACVCAAGVGQEIRRAVPVEVGIPAPTVDGNDLAAFLAGRAVPEDSPLVPLQRSGAYAGHGSAMEGLWTHFDANYFAPMRAWSLVELGMRTNLRRPLLYNFGGPDAIHALALFPDAPGYALVGLEEPGQIPAPLALDEQSLAEALKNLRKSVEVALSYGHFITNDMREDLRRSAFRGVVPLFYTMLGLVGADIVATTFIEVQADGSVRERGPDAQPDPSGLAGVRVVFRKFPMAPEQVLTYVQADLSDAGLRAKPGVLAWAGSLGTPNSYLKAASYLMHGGGFGAVTDDILKRSAAILQDDSGIPMRRFAEGEWRLWFFGTYNGTLELFQRHEQPGLREAFKGAASLPFGTGYKWRRGESNLLLAVKPLPATAVEAGTDGVQRAPARAGTSSGTREALPTEYE